MIETNKLLETGTLWEHLAALRELWANALANMERIRPNLLSVEDKKLMEKLRGAVELVDRHIDLLSKYTAGQTAMMRQVDAIPMLPKPLLLTEKVKDENTDNYPSNS